MVINDPEIALEIKEELEQLGGEVVVSEVSAATGEMRPQTLPPEFIVPLVQAVILVVINAPQMIDAIFETIRKYKEHVRILREESVEDAERNFRA